MLYTITNRGVINARPTVIGGITISINYAQLYYYTISDFTTGTTPAYSDPEGDALAYIKVISLPPAGVLFVNGVPINGGAIVSAGAITSGNFRYQSLESGQTDGYSVSWSFDVADVGSNSLSGLDTGIILMNVADLVNSGPDVVGDRSESLLYSESLTFTSSMFTTGTVPAYNDPEGDSPSKVKIIDLPSTGTLVFNGVDVVANQELSVSEIDLGYLIFNPDLSITSLQVISFNFAVSDLGSGIFTQ
jgi:hypothetical protein